MEEADDDIDVNEALRFALEESAYKMTEDSESLDKPRDPIAAMAMQERE
ncbi:hypothetical protein GOC83_09900 [Haloarcula rubripromontorii]|uniref:Uncharacterized protein n=2 Tax=Haloarcula rubripromontorii TaxID=1705562 RepID=A0A847U4M0_9EURY|nr:hypothetical protein [Haloarcula rubripromontorii]